MWLSEFNENINTECNSLTQPILNIKAIKIDEAKNGLKNKLFCKKLKSCDYFKRKKNKIYFIEVSDFNFQLENLSKTIPKEAKKYIQMEVKLKLSDTLLIYYELLDKFNIKDKNFLQKKVLLVLCRDNIRDIQNIDRIMREFTSHYCPTHFSSIQVIPYNKLIEIFKK